MQVGVCIANGFKDDARPRVRTKAVCQDRAQPRRGVVHAAAAADEEGGERSDRCCDCSDSDRDRTRGLSVISMHVYGGWGAAAGSIPVSVPLSGQTERSFAPWGANS